MKLWKVSVLLAAAAMIAVPANAQDTCATAVAPGILVDPCADLTPTGPLGSCATGGGTLDVWVTFTATETMHRVRTDLNSPGTDSNYIVSSGACGTLTEIGCSEDNVGPYLGDICVTGLTVGADYKVQVGSWGDSCSGGYVVDVQGSGNTCGDGLIACDGSEQCETTADCSNGASCAACQCVAPCPATCAGAIDVGAAGNETLVDPCCDTTQTGPIGSCTGGGGLNDLWLTFVASSSGVRVRTDVNSSGTDSNYVVYSGTCGALVEVGCSEDGAASPNGYLGDINIVGLTPGATYIVQLGGWQDACGPFGVTVQDIPGATCGDGIRAAIVGEDCDPGAVGVAADDGNCIGLCGAVGAADACLCPTPICGNGVREAGEQCDEGSGIGGNGAVGCIIPDCTCTGDCKIATDIVPAVSEWGLVVMVLIGLAAGTVMFGRKRVATA